MKIAIAMMLVCACSAPKDVREIEYSIVGGKPGAALEMAKFQCEEGVLAISRKMPATGAVENAQGRLTQEECIYIRKSVAGVSDEGKPSPVVDGATFILRAKIDGAVVERKWSGMMSESPKSFRNWHALSRRLLKKKLKGTILYQ